MKKYRKNSLFNQYKTLQVNKSRSNSPGPGDYDISLPIVRPNYEAIQKNNDVLILKINHQGQSANFRQGLQRFPQQKYKSPGPAFYKDTNIPNRFHEQKQYKKHSKRYADLIQFMYQNKTRIPPIPDYKVLYDDSQQTTLKQIKNSYRRFRNKSNTDKTQRLLKLMNKSPIQSIVSINSSRVREYCERNDQIDSLIDGVNDNIDHEKKDGIIRTIDYPQPIQQLNYKARNLKKEQDLLLHRKTLYNRNMIGMMISQQKNSIKYEKF